MRVSSKLYLMIVIATLSLVLMAVNSIRQSSVTHGVEESFYKEILPGTRQLGLVNVKILKLRKTLSEYRLNTYEKGVDHNHKPIEDAYADALVALNTYAPFVAQDEQEKALYTKNVENLKAYYAFAMEVIGKFDQGEKDAVQNAQVQWSALGKKLEESFDEEIRYKLKQSDAQFQAEEQGAAQNRVFVWTLTIVSIALTILMGFFIIRSITRPLNSALSQIARIKTTLDFTRLIDTGNAHDEIGQTMEIVNELIVRIRESLREVAQQSHDVANVSRVLAETVTHAHDASAHQAEHSASIAAAIEQMTVSINHIGEQAGVANDKTIASAQHAARGDQVIGHVVDGIQEISTISHTTSEYLQELAKNANSIASTVGLIKDIADQTNLLALNAAIEAARAGEQGRGFAVVADEVRKLAERTGQLTTEIESRIQGIGNSSQVCISSMQDTKQRIEDGVERAGRASVAIQEIRVASQDVQHMVNDITSGILEQTSASNQIAQNVEQIAQMAEEGCVAAEQGKELAVQLKHASQSMLDAVSAYKL